MDSSSTVSVAAVAPAAVEKTVETCQLGDSETNTATVAPTTSTTAPKQQRGNKNRNNHKKNDTPNNESNTLSSSSSKQGNKNNSTNNNNNKNSNPNNATRQQRNSGGNSKASAANHERYNLSANDTAVNDITNKSSPTSNSGNGKKQQQWGGPKKQNLNHLLNFTYESQRENENYYEYERQGRQFWSTKLAKNSYFSKEQFLQAK